jgi:integrase/recombinase XerD
MTTKTYIEPEEIQKLENAAQFLRDKILIRILFYYLGCRISEALDIEVKDINFNACSITILHLKLRINLTCPQCNTRLGKSHTFCPKCGIKVSEAVAKEMEHRKMRTIPLDQETLAMLKDYIQREGPVNRGDRNLIFGFNRHRGWQIIRECANRAGLPKLVNPETGKIHGVSPHKLRDAFAVNAMKSDSSGDGLRLLQEHLGHANFNTTAKYRKVSGDEQRDWYSKLWQNEVKPKDDAAKTR